MSCNRNIDVVVLKELDVTNTPKKETRKKLTQKAFDEATCAICDDDIGTLVFCETCNAAFHPKCYELKQIPDGEFVCRSCSSLQLPKEPKVEHLDLCFFESLSFFRSIEEFHEGTIPRLATDGEAMLSALSSSSNTPDANILRDVHVALLKLCKESGFSYRNADRWNIFLRRRLSRQERKSHDLESLFFLCGGTDDEWKDLLRFLNETSKDYFDLNLHVRSFILLHLCHDVLSVQKKLKKAIQRQREFVGGFRPIGEDHLRRCVYFVEVGRGQFWVVRDALLPEKKNERRVYQTFAFGGVGGIARAHDNQRFLVHFDDDGENLELDASELERILVKEQPRHVELVCRNEENLRLYVKTLEVSKHRSEIKIWHYLKTKAMLIMEKAKDFRLKFQKKRKRMMKMLGLNKNTIAAYENEAIQDRLRDETSLSTTLVNYAVRPSKRPCGIDYSYTEFDRVMDEAINTDNYYSK